LDFLGTPPSVIATPSAWQAADHPPSRQELRRYYHVRRTGHASEFRYDLHARFCIFPHNIAPDFLQYISGKPNQRRPKTMKA
jgi:hypothetical protein